MATRIPNLWSQEDVKVEVLSPLAILHAQADNLEQMTKGLIETEITVTTSEKGETMYQLDAVAPALGGYRHRLLAISHQKDMVYPVQFIPSPSQNSNPISTPLFRQNVSAGTESVFLEKLGEVLQSSSVTAVIQSIIARSNEVQNADQKDETVVEAVA